MPTSEQWHDSFHDPSGPDPAELDTPEPDPDYGRDLDDDRLDAWLTEKHREFEQGLSARLDLDAGLEEVRRKAAGQ